MPKQYQYNFAPKGDHAQEVTTWLKSQSDRSASLKIAILKMIQTYGSTTDLKDLMLQRFVADNNSTPASIPVAKSTPVTIHAQPQLPEPDAVSPITNTQIDQSKPESVLQPESQVDQSASTPTDPSPRSESQPNHEHDARPIPRHAENENDDDGPNFNFLSQRH